MNGKNYFTELKIYDSEGKSALTVHVAQLLFFLCKEGKYPSVGGAQNVFCITSDLWTGAFVTPHPSNPKTLLLYDKFWQIPVNTFHLILLLCCICGIAYGG